MLQLLCEFFDKSIDDSPLGLLGMDSSLYGFVENGRTQFLRHKKVRVGLVVIEHGSS